MDAGGGIALFGELAEGIFSFVGNALAWDSKSKALMSDMKAADDNAELAAAASADAIRRGEIEAGRIRLRGSQLESSMQAAYAAGGVDPTVGTPADTQGYVAAVTQLDAQTAENNAWREAFGYQKQKKGFEREKQKLRQQYGAEQDAYGLNQVGNVAKTAFSMWSTAAKGA